MAYIGNTVQNQGFAPAVDYFNGDGTTVTFTLSRPVASVAQLTAVIDNVIQNPSSAFTVSGSAITFTSAPLAGTNNIWVEYTSLVTTYAAISQDPSVIGDITATGGFLAEGDFGNSYIDGTIVDYVTGRARITTGPIDDMTFYHGGSFARSAMMDLYYAGGAKIYGTTALTIPVGTTGERPGTPADGMTRYNSTLGQFEVYQNGVWTQYASTYSVEYLVVAGGASGGGGVYHGGGGGAGGYISSSATTISNSLYTVVVGAGGAGATGTAVGNNGANSTAFSQTAIGGGGGGNYSQTGAGVSGGSGGGGAGSNAPSNAGGAGTSGQGNAGGNGYNTSPNYGAGGGGGAGAVGVNGGPTTGGNGGAGLNWQSLGTFYAGGGGGSTYDGGTAGSGGVGGGGSGSVSGNNQATSGTANTGGGGGGAERNTYTTSGAGGSGICIIRYAGAQRGSGGTVTSSGGYTYHTFTSSGTYIA